MGPGLKTKNSVDGGAKNRFEGITP